MERFLRLTFTNFICSLGPLNYRLSVEFLAKSHIRIGGKSPTIVINFVCKYGKLSHTNVHNRGYNIIYIAQLVLTIPKRARKACDKPCMYIYVDMFYMRAYKEHCMTSYGELEYTHVISR